MALTELFLQALLGKVHFYITVGRKPALEIFIEGKTIIVEILSPVLAIDAGLQMFLKFRKELGKAKAKKSGGPKTGLTFSRKSGYKIKIRYKKIEFEL